MTTERKTAIIYCDHLLYPSETFIRAQASALRQYLPVYAGSRRVKGLELPSEQTHVINPGSLAGKMREAVFKVFGVAPKLVNQLRATTPELLHAHFGPDGLRALPLARSLHVPLIVTFHGTDATATEVRNVKTSFGHRRYLARRAELHRGAARIIAVSEFIQSKLLAQGFPQETVVVHYIGIDTGMFAPVVEACEPMVLFVGRLTERKGVDYLIRAMGEVQKDFPSLQLVILGDGHQRAELESLAKTSLRNYRFLGAQAPETVRDLMSRAQIFAAPSVRINSGEEEGFGMVFLEAQAMEKPVVSFQSGGIGEAVEHGVSGFLSPERQWRKLAEDIALLARQPDLCRRMGRAGRARVLRHFDLERQTALLENIYLDVVTRFSLAATHV